MKHDVVMQAVEDSWKDEWVVDRKRRNWTWTSDLMVRIEDTTERDLAEDERQYTEEWAASTSSSPPERRCYTIYYGRSFVEVVDMISVDDGAGLIPMPDGPGHLHVSRWRYQFGKILEPTGDHQGNLDQYLRRFGIEVAG